MDDTVIIIALFGLMTLLMFDRYGVDSNGEKASSVLLTGKLDRILIGVLGGLLSASLILSAFSLPPWIEVGGTLLLLGWSVWGVWHWGREENQVSG